MKIVIIEDEFYAAERLKELLSTIDQKFEVVKTIDSVEDTVKYFKNSPNIDLIFLDIQLSDGLSFKIFDSVEISAPIIFTTAFDEYALKAFKVNSIDYLLKPIKIQELKSALNKLEKLQHKKIDHDIQAVMKIMKNHKKDYKKRFLVQIGQMMRPISIENIAYFYTKNEMVFLTTKKGNDYPIEFTLSEIDKSLNPDNFFRINRQIIISYQSIKKIEPYFSNRLILKLKPDYEEDAIVSKRKVRDFKNWLAK